MPKSLISLLLTCIFGVFVGWAVSTSYHRRINYSEKLVYARQIGPLTLYSLDDLGKNQSSQAIDRLERDLDTKIIVIGYYANDKGELGQEARAFLKQAATYRSTSKYTPKSQSVKNRVEYILIHECWDKP